MPIDPADRERGTLPLQLREGTCVIEHMRVFDSNRQILGMMFLRFGYQPPQVTPDMERDLQDVKIVEKSEWAD